MATNRSDHLEQLAGETILNLWTFRLYPKSYLFARY